MNTYMVMDDAGQAREIEADFYERDDLGWVFGARGAEVLRSPC
jgi:hypothetical protein